MLDKTVGCPIILDSFESVKSLQEHARNLAWFTQELWYQHDKKQTVSVSDGLQRAERNVILAPRNLSYLHLQERPDWPSVTLSTRWKQTPFLLCGKTANCLRFGVFFLSFFFILKNLNLCVTANLHTPCHKSPPVSLYSEGANIPSKVPNNSNLIGCLSIREEIPEKLAGTAKSLWKYPVRWPAHLVKRASNLHEKGNSCQHKGASETENRSAV